MGIGTGLYMYDVVLKSSRSLSHLLMSFLSLFVCCRLSWLTVSFSTHIRHFMSYCIC